MAQKKSMMLSAYTNVLMRRAPTRCCWGRFQGCLSHLQSHLKQGFLWCNGALIRLRTGQAGFLCGHLLGTLYVSAAMLVRTPQALVQTLLKPAKRALLAPFQRLLVQQNRLFAQYAGLDNIKLARPCPVAVYAQLGSTQLAWVKLVLLLVSLVYLDHSNFYMVNHTVWI